MARFGQKPQETFFCSRRLRRRRCKETPIKYSRSVIVTFECGVPVASSSGPLGPKRQIWAVLGRWCGKVKSTNFGACGELAPRSGAPAKSGENTISGCSPAVPAFLDKNVVGRRRPQLCQIWAHLAKKRPHDFFHLLILSPVDAQCPSL